MLKRHILDLYLEKFAILLTERENHIGCHGMNVDLHNTAVLYGNDRVPDT